MTRKNLNACRERVSSLRNFKAVMVASKSAARVFFARCAGKDADYREDFHAFYAGGEIGVQPFLFQAWARREIGVAKGAVEVEVTPKSSLRREPGGASACGPRANDRS
jgi:hypothetical protein